MIEKLYFAAASGVEVIVIARSICCLVPGTNGIRVFRLVDRFLEHARIFYFFNNGDEDVFLGSSDWMNRNLHNRVEVSFPVKDGSLKQQILDVLELQIADNTNLVELSENMENISRTPSSNLITNAQADTYKMVSELNT